jgi:hypothetical protein
LTVAERFPHWRGSQLRDRLPVMSAPTTLIVKLKGSPKHITVSAASWEHDAPSGDLVGKDANGKVIAKFDGKEIAGWWHEPVNESLAERLGAVRRRGQEAP